MIERETFGTQTPLHHKKRYNNRLQLGDLRLSTGSDALSYDRGALLFLHGPNAVANTDPFANDPTNNGNLIKQLHYVPTAGGGEVIPQADSYTYDALNRISGVVEPNVFTQTYGYDQWGNRRITGATGGVNNYNPTYDTASNRIVGPSYDQAGNITSDVLTGGTMTYDAENRLQTASAGGAGTYTYDADGKRTRRTALGQETWHIYGVGGELLAEYAANAVPSAPQKEYGYRGGQLLIVAEIGSGGGASFVKPASQSGDDIGGQAGSGMDGAADWLFVVDEPVADLEFNGDYGSTAADAQSDKNIETHTDGVTGTTTAGYSNALSFNGIGGELFADYRAGAAPSAPQNEYGRSGRSNVTVTPQSSSVVNPSSYQTPAPGLGGFAVTNPSNTGHGSTFTAANNGAFKEKSCRWSGFQPVSGQITSITLKVDWSDSGSWDGGGANDFILSYSLDNGSSWNTLLWHSLISANDFGTAQVSLPSTQDISLVQVRDRLIAGAPPEGFAVVSATVSSIRLEVEMDTTAPAISNVVAQGITTSGATITWSTNENSDSQVEYGQTTNYGQSTTLNPALVTAHSQVLSGLAAGTLYHYQIKSKDSAGNLAISTDFAFTTASPPDNTAPVISNVGAGGITTSGATITWNTNENSDSQVEYGQTTAYGQSTTLNPAMVTAHSQVLSGLEAGKLYHYRVKSRDTTGNLAVSGDFTFTTAQNGSGGIKWLVTDHLGSTRMVIDETGSLAGIRRHDFLPFGEELSAGIGIRSASLGYGEDSVRQKFTGYERDETGLDFAQARYYANVQGRFTSVDPLMASATVRNPQTWNRYAYVLNNPLTLIDPDGMKEISVQDCKKDSTCVVVRINAIYDKTANKGAGLTQQQIDKFEKQLLQHAKDTYGVANIALDVSYNQAGFDGKSISDPTAIVASAINVIVTTDLRGMTREAGVSTIDKKGYAFSLIDIDHRDAGDDLLSHEVAHHFAGNTTGMVGGIPMVGDIANAVSDLSNDAGISKLRWLDQTGLAKGNGFYSHISVTGAGKLPNVTQQKVPFYDSARKFQEHLLKPRK
jgi:RHS repeat-associated protein